jgi:ATP synthase protein I
VKISRGKGLDQEKHEEFSELIKEKEKRKMKARSERDQNIWFGLGMFGTVGWSVAIPTLIGVALGLWLDVRYPSRVSWTLTLLVTGLVIGCLNAWFWIKRKSQDE